MCVCVWACGTKDFLLKSDMELTQDKCIQNRKRQFDELGLFLVFEFDSKQLNSNGLMIKI